MSFGSVDFVRSSRFFDVDRGFLRLVVALVTSAILALWGLWLCLARISLDEHSVTARLEVKSMVHSMDAPVSAQVLQVLVAVGEQVEANQLLVRLDADHQSHELQSERLNEISLEGQVEAVESDRIHNDELAAVERELVKLERELAAAQLSEALSAAKLSQREYTRSLRLHQQGLFTEADLSKLEAETEQKQAKARVLELTMARAQQDQLALQPKILSRSARSLLEHHFYSGYLKQSRARIEDLEGHIELRNLRAPISGRIGFLSPIKSGSFVKEGQPLLQIVPAGPLQVCAYFAASTASGRLAVGQSAIVRLDGFPWPRFGTLRAVLQRVGTEPDPQGRIPVFLELTSQGFPVPLEHGMTGVVEVEVEQVSPIELLLRGAGARPKNVPTPQAAMAPG